MLHCNFLVVSSLILLYNALGIMANPWKGYMDRYNIPLVHGSGVYTDLGASKRVNGKLFREPAGKCPNMGKVINLEQPTTNSVIWPRDFTERIPTAKSIQDTKPLGGGLAMWRANPSDISPLTVSQLKDKVKLLQNQTTPNKTALELLKNVKSDYDYCAWWARITYAADSSSSAFDDKYRYPFVWDENEGKCTLLSVAMQHLQGEQVCTSGNVNVGTKDWYCMHGQKQEGDYYLSWNSPYIRPDHDSICPKYGVLNAHFGQFNGTTCTRLAVVKRLTSTSPEECAEHVFRNSASDAPTRYDRAPVMDELYKDWSAGVGTLWPAGAFGSDSPHSRGVGINYANWYLDGSCELYDSLPNCFVQAPNQYAFTGLSSPSRYLSEPPPCNQESNGWVVEGECNCGFYDAQVYECNGSEWSSKGKSCHCYLALGLGLGLGIPALLLLIGGIIYYYRRKKRNQGSKSEKKPLVGDKSTNASNYLNADEITGQGGKSKRRSDFKQEAEPSFWGETESNNGDEGNDTNIIIAEEPNDFYYE